MLINQLRKTGPIVPLYHHISTNMKLVNNVNSVHSSYGKAAENEEDAVQKL